MLIVLLGACLIQDEVYQANLDRLTDADGDGYLPADDCDDDDDSVHPEADERCNGADDDCDGAIDEDAVDLTKPS
jgi:Putative metal-binding motif